MFTRVLILDANPQAVIPPSSRRTGPTRPPHPASPARPWWTPSPHGRVRTSNLRPQLWRRGQTSSGRCPRPRRHSCLRCGLPNWSPSRRQSCLQVGLHNAMARREADRCRAHQHNSRLPPRRRHVQICSHVETHAGNGIR